MLAREQMFFCLFFFLCVCVCMCVCVKIAENHQICCCFHCHNDVPKVAQQRVSIAAQQLRMFLFM